MATRIQIAQSANEIDQVFQIRHVVYVEQGGYREPYPQGRLFDRFDGLPGAVSMTAEVDGQRVGTVRFIRDVGVGTHANDYYDFSGHLPSNARVGSGSMLAVYDDWQGRPRLTFSLVGMCIYHAARTGCTHLLGTVNPEVLDGFLRLGFTPVDGILIHQPGNLPFVPVVLRLDKLEGRIKAFVAGQLAGGFLPDQHRLFVLEGEDLSEIAREDEGHHVIGGTLLWTGERGTTVEFGVGDYIPQFESFRGEATRSVIATTRLDLVAVPPAQPQASRSTTTGIVVRPTRSPQLFA